MSNMNIPLVNLNGGEIGQEAVARVDLDLYPTCADTMENILPLMQGAMIKAPGTEYIGRSFLDSTAIVRPFVFSVDQTRVLEISDGRIDIVSGNAYVDIDGAAATVGTPVDNGSTGGSSVAVSGQNVTFTASASGEAAAYWPITGGVAGSPVTFRFEIERRPLSIRVGTATGLADIGLPGPAGPAGETDITLDPGIHILTFTPTAASYFIRARLREHGKAVMKGLTRLAGFLETGSGGGEAWTHMAPIVIQQSEITGSSTLTNFPVLLTQDCLPDDFKNSGLFQANGGDIRFTSDVSGQQLIPCEVVSFSGNATPANATCEIWVKVPSVSPTVDTTFYMWRRSGAGVTQPAVTAPHGRNAVWSDYLGVWHGDDLTDSTGNGNNLTAFGGATVGSATAQIGKAFSLSRASSQYLSAGSPAAFDNLAAVTVQCWARNTAPIDFVMVVGKTMPSGDTPWYIWNDESAGGVAGYNFFAAGGGDSPEDTEPPNTWAFTAGGYGGAGAGSATKWHNGDPDPFDRGTDPIDDAAGNFNIGYAEGGAGGVVHYDGQIDEVRLRAEYMSNDWMQADFATQSDPGGFAEPGAVAVQGGEGVILGGGGSADGFFIPTPWRVQDLRRLRYRQSLDTYWLYHPSYRTRVLERRGNTSWSLRLFRPLDGPFEAPNVSAVTLAPSALVGNATVTASLPLFSAVAGRSSVGQLIEITHRGQTETETFSAVDQATGAIRVFGTSGTTSQSQGFGGSGSATISNRKFQLVITGTFTATLELQRSVNEVDWLPVDTYTAATSVTIDDELDNQIIFYRVLVTAYTSGAPAVQLIYAGGETTGRAEIVAVNSATNVEVEIYEAFGSTAASAIWSIGAWSDALGWGAAGTIDDGRHCLVRDDRFWASTSDDYESFLLGVDAADAISRRFGTGEMNSSRWIESGRRLLIGTSGAEIEVTSNALDEPITPLTNRLKGFDDNGSADTQAMKAPANRILFIERTRTKLYQCLLDSDTAEQHDTDDLTRLHEEIAGLISEEEAAAGEGGFVEIAVQRKPAPRVWCVRSDGELAVLLFGPREGVYAWARITAAETGAGAGAFRSVCVIPGAPEDRVHVMVERIINGHTRLHHERFSLQKFAIESETVDGREVRTAPDAWRLQAALYSSDEVPADEFTGLDHLEGETVHIWADGRVHPPRVVENGAITLDAEFNTVIVGLNYIGKWKSVKMAYGAQLGTALTMDKNVGRIGFSIRDTPLGAISYGRTFEEALSRGQQASGGDDLHEAYTDNEGDFVMDAPVPLVSGDFSQSFEGMSDIDARVCIVMDTPMPAKILGMVPGVELHEHS